MTEREYKDKLAVKPTLEEFLSVVTSDWKFTKAELFAARDVFYEELLADNPYCDCCGKFIYEDDSDYYMVNNDLWREVVKDFDLLLCLDCFKKKLGRPLVYSDFTDAPVNGENPFVQSLWLAKNNS